MITVLDKDTIDKIAAGEVIERPVSVVKELAENAIDAGSASVTVEIKDGGISMIRVTDNGCGVRPEEVVTAFKRHATSKIRTADDLNYIHTLGFRGEALSSIAAVSRTEMITRTSDSVTGIRYTIDGGNGKTPEEVGAPEGTTVIIRDLFYNVPARRKFLKTPSTEAAHISELMEMLALSHPDVAFTFISNGQIRLKTSGKDNLNETVFRIYGRDITSSLLPVDYEGQFLKIHGVIGKPDVTRSSRNNETYFVNGRYIKSGVISKAIEDAYGNRLMQHRFPFAVLQIVIDPEKTDVNVHPTKMDVRFSEAGRVYDEIYNVIKDTLDNSVLIPKVNAADTADIAETDTDNKSVSKHIAPSFTPVSHAEPFEINRKTEYVQEEFVPIKIEESKQQFTAETDIKIIGQVFDTYWIIQKSDNMYILDQHAAHEKVMYERLIKSRSESGITSQQIDPPLIITLSDTEADVLNSNYDSFRNCGYEIEHFGGKEYAIYAVPAELPSVSKQELIKDMISELSNESGKKDVNTICAKTAGMACKAAIKGGQRISYSEAQILIKDLFKCENPFNCPHGRPTMIEYSKSDIEKLFKRIV